MLSRADNELLGRVGPGTPMGNLLRQYLFPALPSDESPLPRAPRAASRRRVRIKESRCTLAARRLGNRTGWHRINQFIFPFRTMISVGDMVNLRWFVPLDDHYATLVLNEDAGWKAILVDARNADFGLLPSADVPLVL